MELKFEFSKDFIDSKPISIEVQRKMWMDIIETMHSRSRSNYNKVTEIGNELIQLKGSPEQDQNPFVRNFTCWKTNKSLLITLSKSSKTG